MKNLLLLPLLLACSNTSFIKRMPSSAPLEETFSRLKSIYPEQSDAFIQERYKSAPNAFQKWRSFPPYYYELINRMSPYLGDDFFQRPGLCAGDPHLENFGFIFLKNTIFTVNDLDDATPCSLNADAMRLFIGHRLVTSFNSHEWLEEYKSGLSGQTKPLPDYLKHLEAESLKNKTKMPLNLRRVVESKNCSGSMLPVTSNEEYMLKDMLTREGKQYLFACSRNKASGGSAGQKRYLVFHQQPEKLEAFEIKPLATPAPIYQIPLTNEEREVIFKKAVNVFLSPKHRSAWYPVKLQNKLYQRRPIWTGNTEIKETDLSPRDLNEVILFQARTLGNLHRKTQSGQTLNYSSEQWEKLGKAIERQWRSEFGE